jgi:glycosyltransferase involved in cell wall biosynthesis
MNKWHDLESAKDLVRQNERNSDSSRWLIRQLGNKIRHFPRDFLRRFRRSLMKRLSAKTPMPDQSALVEAARRASSLLSGVMEKMPPFEIVTSRRKDFVDLCKSSSEARNAVAAMEAYLNSDLMRKQVAEAVVLDRNVGALTGRELKLCAPWHDADYQGILEARKILPTGPFESVILVPFGKLGGADFVAGVLARAVSPLGPTLILRTEGSDWERPDWYPETVASVDISQILSNLSQKTRVLYVLIGELSPKRIYNVNSRLCFEMFAEYGARLATQFRLYAYYFCADRSPEGVEAGYPVWFCADLIPHLHAALFDTKDLAETLAARYNLSPELKAKLCAIYTPALTPLPLEPMVKLQIASRAGRPRPRLIWAGRFDRQKRFDILLQIAEQMPDVDFDCWGKAVLDAPPDFSRLPKNVRLNPPFASYDELPLANSDGWIYTSEWDGLPTILIEIAALGVPVTASAVGGVPELIDEDTGWPVRAPEDPKAYVAALREMLGDADLRASKVEALQARIRSRHVVAAYEKRVHEV